MNRIRFYLMTGILSLLPLFLAAQPLEWEEVTSGVESPQVLGLKEDKTGGIYATTSGGLFYSRNYGENWEWVCNSSDEFFNTYIVFDTTTIVAFKRDSCFHSTDRGKTWKLTNNFASSFPYNHFISSDNVNTIYCTAQFGKNYVSEHLFVSTNRGITWSNISTRITPEDSIQVDRIVALPNGVAYTNVGGVGTSGVYKTTDYGSSWKKISVSYSGDLGCDAEQNVWIFDPTLYNPAMLYIFDNKKNVFKARGYKFSIAERIQQNLGPYHITDQKQQRRDFSNVQSIFLPKDSVLIATVKMFTTSAIVAKISCKSSDPLEQVFSTTDKPWYVQSLLMGSNGYIYLATGGGVYRSKDTCKTWERTTNGMRHGSDIYDIHITTDGSIYAATSGGIFYSRDNLASWQYLSISAEYATTTSVYRLNNGSIFAGTSGGAFSSTDNGKQWLPITNLPTTVATTSFLQLPSNLLFAACEGYKPYYSTDGGIAWQLIDVGKECSRFIRHTPTSTVFGVNELMRFNEKIESLDYGFGGAAALSRDMAIDSNGKFYFASSNGLYTSVFVNSTATEAGVSGYLSRVAVNAVNQVITGDYNSNLYFRRSSAFENCRTGLPGAPIRALAVLPDQRVLVGTDWGLFVSKTPSVVTTTPELQQPSDKSHPYRVGVSTSWSKAQYARYYHLQIARDSLFTDLLVNDSLMASTSKALPTLGFGERYYWRVRSILAAQRSEWTPVWTFTTLPDVPKTPQLQLPENNTNVNGASTTLQWKAGQYAERYRLQVSNAPNFATILVEDSTLTTESYELQSLGQDTKYYWRVHSINLTGSSGWTTPWSFVANPNIGVEEPQTGGIQAYPNPANEEIVVQFPASIIGKTEIIIVSSIGETLRHIPVHTPVSELKIGVKDLASGRYSLRILSGGTEQIVPIAIQR